MPAASHVYRIIQAKQHTTPAGVEYSLPNQIFYKHMNPPDSSGKPWETILATTATATGTGADRQEPGYRTLGVLSPPVGRARPSCSRARSRRADRAGG